MADTTARALRLLELLQSAQLRSTAELSHRLGVDERTVRRDVARLVDLGIPVEAVRGRYGGYRLLPGQSVLPPMFTTQEVVAVYLGIAQAWAATPGSDLVAQTALAKIKRALPIADAQRIDALLGAIPATPGGRAPTRRVPAPDPAVMLAVAAAVTRRQPVELHYRNRDGVPSRRTVHPRSLVARDGRWYLLAFDIGAQAERVFRVDRIRTARAMPGTFAPTEGGDGERVLLDHLATAHYRWLIVLRIRGSEGRIREQLPPTVALLRRLERAGDMADGDGPAWYRAEIHAESLDWLPGVLAALDCEVVIEQPDELRERVRAAAARMLRSVGDGR